MVRAFRVYAYWAACAVAVAAAGALAWWLVMRSASGDVEAILSAYDEGRQYGPLTITYPLPDTLFPPDITAPTFRWRDRDGADRWLVAVWLAGRSDCLTALCDDAQWTPSDEQWAAIRSASVDEPARVTVLGVRRADRRRILSAACVPIRTSRDPVGAPILYREVNLPFLDATKDPSRIRWRLGDISSPAPPPIILENLPVCANCHSFSADGKVMGLDVDYANDKGSYAVLPVAAEVTLDKSNIISWSDFRREDGAKTLGMLSQVSPDGRYVISTVKDRSVFVPKGDLAFSQLFFPIKGILAVYDRETKQFHALPGADDPAYVQSNGSWSPDGKWIVFARHTAYHLRRAREGNDDAVLLMPDECIDFLEGRQEFLFDLYRVPFNDGRGGTPEPLAGASHNGMSNYFARYSPDGKWIVFCKAKTFMLLQPDSELYIIPAEGGEARRLECNTPRMNSWHSWSPNGKWLVFSSKADSPYTHLCLTHIDESGRSTPPVLLSHFTSADRAANIPEFVNLGADTITRIREQFVDDYSYARTGLALARQGEHAMAVDAFRRALEINPDSAWIHESLAVSLMQLGRLEEAKACLQESIRALPQSVSARCNLGTVLIQLGQRDEALEAYRDAVACDPQSAAAHALLGSLLFQLGALDEARTLLADALRLDPTQVDARLNLATLLLQTGHTDQAADHWRQVLEQHPESLPALLSLASLRASSGEPAQRDGREALRLAARGCELTGSQDVEALDILGMAYAECGQFDAAASAARSALRLASTGADSARQDAIRSRIRLYEQQRPYRRAEAP